MIAVLVLLVFPMPVLNHFWKILRMKARIRLKYRINCQTLLKLPFPRYDWHREVRPRHFGVFDVPLSPHSRATSPKPIWSFFARIFRTR